MYGHNASSELNEHTWREVRGDTALTDRTRTSVLRGGGCSALCVLIQRGETERDTDDRESSFIYFLITETNSLKNMQ